MFNSNFLDVFPNLFSKEDYNDDYDEPDGLETAEQAQILRIISSENVSTKEQKCVKNRVLRANQFSCYFLNSAGQHIFHLLIYLVAKLFLVLVVSVCLGGADLNKKTPQSTKSRKQKKSNFAQGPTPENFGLPQMNGTINPEHSIRKTTRITRFLI